MRLRYFFNSEWPAGNPLQNICAVIRAYPYSRKRRPEYYEQNSRNAGEAIYIKLIVSAAVFHKMEYIAKRKYQENAAGEVVIFKSES